MDKNLELKVEEIRRRQEAMEVAQSEFLRAAQSELKAAIQSESKAAIQSESKAAKSDLKAAIQSEVEAAIRSEFTRRFGQQIVDLDLGLGRETEPGEYPKKRPPSPLEPVLGNQHVQTGLLPMEYEEKDPELSIKFGMIIENNMLEDDERSRSRIILRYDIYVVDVDDCRSIEVNEYTPIAPKAQFKFRPEGFHPAVCSVKSTLYVFEGSYYHDMGPPLLEATNPNQKAAYRIGFPFDHDHQLTAITPMNHLKTYPIALPTPDGHKILLFSKKFLVKESHTAFEVLNIKDESWTEVPPLPLCLHSCTKSESFDAPWCPCKSSIIAEAEAYSFIDPSHFLLQICFGVFVLDLEEMKWTRLRDRRVAPNDHVGYFEIVEGRYLLIPRREPTEDVGGPPALWACDFGEDGFLVDDGFLTKDVMQTDEFEFRGGKSENWCHLSDFPPQNDMGQGVTAFSILPLRPQEQQEGLCTSRVVHVDSEPVNSESGLVSNVVNILVNVCRTDLATMKTSVSKAAGLTYSFPKTELPCEITVFNI